MDITVEDRQRFAAFKIKKVGALSTSRCKGNAVNNRGITANAANTAGESV